MAIKKKKGFWSNPWVIGIGTTIASTLILQAFPVGQGTTFIGKIWSAIVGFAHAVGSFFVTKYSFPLWLIIIVGLLALISVISFFMGLVSKEDDNSQDWLNYTTDIFDGVRYVWLWRRGNDGRYLVREIQTKCAKDNAYLLNNACPICQKRFFNIKSDAEIEILIHHKVDNVLYNQVK